MGIWQVYGELERLAAAHFSDIVIGTEILLLPSGDPLKLHLQILDGSLLDVYLSLSGRYFYHWERRLVSGEVYRHDNAPRVRWNNVSIFPKHFHDGREDNVVESRISGDPATALREFLTFVREKLQTQS